MRSTSRLLAALVVVTALAPAARAGGPLLLFDPATQTPYAWGPSVSMYTDLGPFGSVTNAQADAITADAAATWSAVPTSSFSASVVGDFNSIGLPDITATNASQVVGVFNGGGIHVMYDTDGTLIQSFFGAPPGVLGIASPEFASGSTLTESWMVMNGAAVNAGDLPNADSFAGVFTHEMGHAINLAHTQTNGGIIFFGDDRGPGGCGLPYTGGTLGLAQTETMFPFIDPSPGSTGVAQATVTHLDDQATLSDIYPASGYPGNFATIEGTVFATDGTTPLTGVNVIVRNVADAYDDAQSAMSGDFTQGALGPDGRFRLTGLTPGADYVLYVDEIIQGGFSTPPVQPLPGPEEWWNNGETNVGALDDPCAFTAVNVAAGQPVTLDVQLNDASTANPPAIGVTPAGLSFSVPPNGTDAGVVTIENTAIAPALDLNWSVSENPSPCPWLSFAPASGTTPQGGSDAVNVSVDATGLAPGVYTCDLVIASDDPSNPVVPVAIDLEVQAAQEIQVIVDGFTDGPVAVQSRPDGNGRALSNAVTWSGTIGDPSVSVDATISVRLIDEFGTPVTGFPAENIGLVAASGGWIQCDGQEITADADTDANGRTTISGALFAGGHSETGELMQVIVDDPSVTSTSYPGGLSGLEYFVNGPDLTGDLASDLVDVGEFAIAFSGAYDFAADLVYNGTVDLADVGEFSLGFGSTCPAVPSREVADGGVDDAVPSDGSGVPAAEVGVYFDAGGTKTRVALEPGTRTTAWVVARGAAVEQGVTAFDLALRVSDNVIVHDRTLVDAAVSLGEGADALVGFGTERRVAAGEGLTLLRVVLGVRDDAPAEIWLGPSSRSDRELPSFASDGAVVTARPVSGAVGEPVASMNAELDAVATPRSLSMGVAPNPFNPATEIRFALPRAGRVELRILNARGALVTVLRNEVLQAGEHAVTWNGTDRSGSTVGSGTYYSMLVTESGTVTEKLMLVK